MPFAKGDVVRVREGLVGGESYNELSFATSMEQYCGREFVVTYASSNGKYLLDGAADWMFSDEMLESVETKEYYQSKISLDDILFAR